MGKTLMLFGLLFCASITIHAQDWLTDIEDAKNIASEKKQHILLVFQGSDWCAPCMKLEKEIWSSEEFRAYAKNNLILLKADFPRKKKNKLDAVIQKKNNKLMETYNKQGFFPLVVVLSSDGKLLGKTGYKKIKPTEYIQLLASF